MFVSNFSFFYHLYTNFIISVSKWMLLIVIMAKYDNNNNYDDGDVESKTVIIGNKKTYTNK